MDCVCASRTMSQTESFSRSIGERASISAVVLGLGKNGGKKVRQISDE